MRPAFNRAGAGIRYKRRAPVVVIENGISDFNIVACARAAYQIDFDPKHDERRVMTCVKSNLGPHAPELTFTLATSAEHPTHPHLEWGAAGTGGRG